MNDPPRRGTMRTRSLAFGRTTSTMRVKILMVGDSMIGKSSFAKRVCHEAKLHNDEQQKRHHRMDDKFIFDTRIEPTVGVDFISCPVMVRNQGSGGSTTMRINPNLFDLSGSDIHSKVRSEFYSDFHGILLCFDLTSKSSWDHLDSWVSEVAGPRSDLGHLVVLGLKSDLPQRTIQEREIKTWCKGRGATYFECSSKTGVGVWNAWSYLLEHAQGEIKPPIGGGGGIFGANPTPSSSSHQSQRPPSASPSPPPNGSSSSSSSHGGATNISDLTLSELRRECAKRNISLDPSASHADALSKLRDYLARERQSKSSAESAHASKLDRAREEVLEDVARWARGKDLRTMLNDIHQWTQHDPSYLQTHASFAPVSLAYKKAVVKIHPDKVSTSLDNGLTHLRATEMFKTVNAAFEQFKKVNEKRGSGGLDGSVQQPAASPTHSPPHSATMTPRTRRR